MTEPGIRGVITAMATPFAADGTLDLEAARSLARHLVGNGSHGLVVAGTTGESPTLNDLEKLRLLETVLDEVGDRATVIAGTGSNDTRHSCELTGKAARAGAHGVLVVTPYYNKPNETGLREHFAAVAEAAGETPVILYNIPSRCVINVSPELIADIAAASPNVVAVKQANNDELEALAGVNAVALLAGNDEVFLRTLELGGAGGILVASHVVGNEMRAVFDAAEGGGLERARELDEALHGVYGAMAVTANPIPVKTALELLGVIDANVRLPLVRASEAERAAVREALERQGALVAGRS
jgi:4-hydroxy-tetrahydrodipicolinate synthase